MSAAPDEGTILTLVKNILSHGVDGLGPMNSSAELARQYRDDASYPSDSARIDALIRWESAKNFGTGFATGLGGLATMPITLPASLYTAWFVQARLSGAIADLNGHSTQDERVRTFILLTLIGDSAREVLKTAGVTVANKVALNAVRAIPGRVLLEINKKVGFRLITKAGSTGVINLTKVVPVLGGVVGGTVDAAACAGVGKTAKKIFGPA